MATILTVALVLIALLIVSAGSGCRRQSGGAGAQGVTSTTIRSMSRADIEQMLRNLASRKAPQPTMGAMCYEMAAPPARAEYVCPVCGQKTLYTKELARTVEWEVDSCRRELALITTRTPLRLTLDESSFCKHCSPNAKARALALVVTYGDGTSHRTSPVSLEDLSILAGFLGGDDSYKTSNDGTSPLVLYLPRLRELLGTQAEEKRP